MTRTNTRWTALGLLAALGVAALGPAAMADQQKNKNDWRNLAGVGAAVAGYGLLKHNSTATVLGAAGAAYSANRYEQDRHHQSQANDARNRRYYRSTVRHPYHSSAYYRRHHSY